MLFWGTPCRFSTQNPNVKAETLFLVKDSLLYVGLKRHKTGTVDSAVQFTYGARYRITSVPAHCLTVLYSALKLIEYSRLFRLCSSVVFLQSLEQNDKLHLIITF